MLRAVLLGLLLAPPLAVSVPSPSAAAAAAGERRVVVLGDSYASGSGAGGYVGPSECYRSPGAWGELYRAWLVAGGQPATLTNLACSGTTTAGALSQVAQLDPAADLVLLTLGGNDVGFSDVVQSCFVPGLRSAPGCRSRVEQAQAIVDDPGPGGLVARLATVLTTIHARAPRARVVLMGYPHLIGTGFSYVLAGQPDYDAGPELRALGDRGMAAQRAAVERAGAFARYVPVAAAFAGHEPEPRLRHTNPQRWLLEVGDSLVWRTWYHPNPAGHAAYRDILVAAIGAAAPNRAPVAAFAHARLAGAGNLVVVDARGSTDPDGRVTSWRWVLAGAVVATGAIVVIPLGPAATRDLTLVVTDDWGAETALTRPLAVGNRAPIITAVAPQLGSATNTTPALYTSSVDPDGDPLRFAYRIVGPGLDLSSGWVAGAWRVPTGRLVAGRTYQWSVTAQDPAGAATTWAGQFTVVTSVL